MIKRIIITRHGESIEDIDPTLHNICNGKVAELTDKGKAQANQLGLSLKDRILPNEKYKVYVSTAFRAQETWVYISHKIHSPVEVVADPRIRNLNWG
jgi:broad specificity phosphatase PhoE